MRLAKREKYVVAITACGLGVFLLLQFIIFPFFEERAHFKKGIQAEKKRYQTIATQITEYNALQTNSQGIDKVLAKRKRGFTLFSFLEKEAGTAQVKDRIKSMKPSSLKGTGPFKELMVDMELNALTLNQLVDYLYRIESPEDLIMIKRIAITEDKRKPGLLNAKIQVITFE